MIETDEILHSHDLNLTPTSWKSIFRRHVDERYSSTYIHSACSFRPQGTKYHLEGQSEPVDCDARLNIYRKHEPELIEGRPHPITELMHPAKGATPPFGVARLDQGGPGGSFHIILYPGRSILDELWARLRYGGVMPTEVAVTLKGVTFDDQHDVHWTAANSGWLPVTHFTFEAELLVPGTDK